MFRTDLLSILRSLNTVSTAIGVCYTSYVDYLLARSGLISKKKAGKQRVLLACIIRIYHDARPSECHITPFITTVN